MIDIILGDVLVVFARFLATDGRHAALQQIVGHVQVPLSRLIIRVQLIDCLIQIPEPSSKSVASRAML